MIEQVVDALDRGQILSECREMQVVFIPKREHDLMKMKNWHPLNLINYIRKLGEKVVVDQIQNYGAEMLH